MSLKIILLLAFSAVVVNTYSIQTSEERRSWLEGSASSLSNTGFDGPKTKRHGEASYHGSQQEMGRRGRFGRRSQIQNDEEPRTEEEQPRQEAGSYKQSQERGTTLNGRKMKVSLSSSSEESYGGSYEFKQVEKQYHGANPSNTGNGRLARSHIHTQNERVMSDFRGSMENSIDKDGHI